jgi:ABC-type uncharacterized transport system permease subunit
MNTIDHALGSSLRIGTPLLFAGMGELLLERAGMINIGIEGVMLCGAFGGFYFAWLAQSPLIGAAAGAICGTLFMLIFALMTLKIRAEQIVTGMALNLIAAGATSTAYEALSSKHSGEVLSVPALDPVSKSLSAVPFIGSLLFSQTLLTWAALVLIPLLWLYLEKSERGLEFRAVGENPAAAQAAGINVTFTRLKACLACGALCGVGGAFLTVSQTSSFASNCTSGRGFVALAAVVLGRHGAFGTAAASLFFGAAFFMRDAVPATSAAVELVEILPYALTILALCWKFKSRPAPAALGKIW